MIDLGLTIFATLSTGEKIDAPKPLRVALKHLRTLSCKQKGRNRRKAARLNVARFHARVADAGWRQFRTLLESKAAMYGRTVSPPLDRFARSRL